MTITSGCGQLLVVDDRAGSLSAAVTILEDAGYGVTRATSATEVVELLTDSPVDCLLVASGETLRTLRAGIRAIPALQTLPVVMLTASADARLIAAALEDGADDAVAACGEMDTLKARVGAQVRRARREAGQFAAAAASHAETLARKDQELIALDYAVSHDVRAPLRAIYGFSRIVLEECADVVGPTQLDYLQRVCAAAREMGGLLDDLLQLSRVSRAELRRGPVDLSELARRAAAALRERSDQAVDVAIEDGMVVDADHRLARTVIEQLIGNSWKFTANTAGARIEVGAQPTPDGLTYVVRDNGAGFDMTRVDKLFKPFQRLHSQADFVGAGIGLAIVHRIIDRHGGRVWAEGHEGSGATIYFTLPPSLGRR